jgi:hypothetical protein
METFKIRIPRKLKKWFKNNGELSEYNSKYIRIHWKGLSGKNSVIIKHFYDKKTNSWKSYYKK